MSTTDRDLMNRSSTILTMATILVLAGCGGPPASGPSVTPEDPAASPAPTSSETPVLGPWVFPECADLYAPDQVLELMGDNMDSLGDVSGPGRGGYGTSRLDLQTLMEERDGLHCTWVLPATERGLSVSITLATDADLDSVDDALSALGSTPVSVGGPSFIYSFDESVETDEFAGEYPFSEAHLVSPGLWISAVDSFGEFAPALVQAAADRMFVLNPGRF